MEHHFVIEIAEEYGVNEAILIYNIDYWLHYNQTNNKNFYEGKYWMYNSYSAFTKQFTYLSESQIYRLIKKLKNNNIIITGNFNKNKYDQTKWYTLSDEFIIKFKEHLRCSNLISPLSRNRKMEFTQTSNRNNETVKPIPNIKPIIKSNNKIREKSENFSLCDFFLNNINEKEKTNDFYIPTLDEVKEFAKQINSDIDPELYFEHLQDANWTTKKGKIRYWKLAFRALDIQLKENHSKGFHVKKYKPRYAPGVNK